TSTTVSNGRLNGDHVDAAAECLLRLLRHPLRFRRDDKESRQDAGHDDKSRKVGVHSSLYQFIGRKSTENRPLRWIWPRGWSCSFGSTMLKRAMLATSNRRPTQFSRSSRTVNRQMPS